jgi:hypothetical protein
VFGAPHFRQKLLVRHHVAGVLRQNLEHRHPFAQSCTRLPLTDDQLTDVDEWIARRTAQVSMLDAHIFSRLQRS